MCAEVNGPICECLSFKNSEFFRWVGDLLWTEQSFFEETKVWFSGGLTTKSFAVINDLANRRRTRPKLWTQQTNDNFFWFVDLLWLTASKDYYVNSKPTPVYPARFMVSELVQNLCKRLLVLWHRRWWTEKLNSFSFLQTAASTGLTSSPSAAIVNKPTADDLYRNSSTKALRRTKRGVFQLSGIIKCITGCKPLSYRRYGCFCGYMGAGKWPFLSIKEIVEWIWSSKSFLSGQPVDNIDKWVSLSLSLSWIPIQNK